MKKLKQLVFLVIFLFSNSISAQTKAPNIVLFLVDDMGWQDTSVPFAKEITDNNRKFRTPNMEKLAAKGVKFTSAYASSVCSPSRISLFSGSNAARHRVTNWTLHKNQKVDENHPILNFPEWNVNGMSPEPGIEKTFHAQSLAQILKNAGYQTIHSGKAHFGAIGTPAENPINIGFQINIAGHAAGGPGSFLGEENYGNKIINGEKSVWGVPGLDKYHGTQTYLTEALTIEALNALDKRDSNKPFFLYLSHYAVHVPIAKDKRFYQKYIDQGLGEKEATYAAMVEGMDKSLGNVMDYLQSNNLEENTIILFMSDNGGLSASHALGGEMHKHNKPLNSGKGSAYEGGIRVPMIVYWPGKSKPMSVCDQYVIVEDFFPTILEMAAVKTPKTPQIIDGKSFATFISNPNKKHNSQRSLYWNFPNNWGPTGPGIGPSATIRKGIWKLIYYYSDQRKELFNLQEDIGELKDLAELNPKITNSLSKDLGNYLRKVNAQRPISKTSGNAIKWPDEN